MAIERTGSVVTIEIPTGTENLEGSQSVSVPSDCDFIVAVFAAYRKIADWFNDPICTLGSDAFTQQCATDPMDDNGQTLVFETLADPDTGTQTFYWDYSDSQTGYAGRIIHLIFYKGVDSVHDSGVNSSGNDVTGLSYDSGDMMVGAIMSFNSSVTVTESSQTSIINPSAFSYTILACAEKTGTGSFDTSGGSDVAAAALTLKPGEVTRHIEAGLGLSSTIGGSANWDGSVEQLGLSAEFGVSRELTRGITNTIGLADTLSSTTEIVRGIVAGVGLSHTSGGINLTTWVAANGDRIVPRYEATLTGDADGLADYTLPGLKSIQTRMRDGEASYLGLSLVYTAAAATAIAARPNGDLVVEMIAVVDGAESLREELIRVDFDSIRYDRGASSQSISLAGYRTRSYTGGRVALADVVTETLLADGSMQYRCARPGFYLRPGDTVVYGTTEVLVDAVSCMVSAAVQYMDVSGDIVAAGSTAVVSLPKEIN